MKQFGKRTLSMLLALGLTASMLASDLSVMQVNAEGSVDYTAEGESSILEMVAEGTTTESSLESASEENASESISEEITSEEPSAETEEGSGEDAVVEPSSIEDITEAMSEELNATEAGTPDEQQSSSQTEPSSLETGSTEETSTEEGTDTELTEVLVGDGYTFWVDKQGVLSVTFENTSLTKISGEITIPMEVKSIPKDEELFYSNTQITKVTFEEGSLLERIEDEAFFASSSLTEIKIPSGVSYIGEKAFHSSGIKKLVLEAGDTVVEVGDMAFQKNAALTTIVTNKRLGSIGKYAFAENAALKTFVGTSASDPVDEGALVGVTSIGERAFAGCSSLEYITIPDSVTVIEEGTFENCTSLGKNTDYFAGVKSVKLGNGVTKINASAFAGCSSLTEVSMPASVTSIGANVFNGCTGLKKVTLKNQSGDNKACAVKLTDTSFPYIKGLVVEAYDGTAQEWVGLHSSYGVEFVSLYENYSISYAEIKNGTVKANVAKAKVGTEITLTVTPDEGYTLKFSKLWYTYTDNLGNEQSGKIDPWNYTFEMPEYPVQIHATFVKIADLEYGEGLKLTEDGLLNPLNKGIISFDSDKNILDMGKPWQTVKIQVTGSNGEIPGISELDFASANEKIVTVDSYGNLRSLAAGETTITVALKDETKGTKPLELTVKVGKKTTVKDLALTYKVSMGIVQYASENGTEASETGYDIITYPASVLKLGSRNVVIQFNGTDEEGHKLDVTYQITSNDKSVAKPASAKVTGEGKLTIPKNALGETFVTVKAVDGSDEPAEYQFIVRVIDDTPRLADSTIDVDPQSDKGTLLDLVSVYGNTSDMSNFYIASKKVKNGVTTWEKADDMFELSVEGDEIYLKAKAKTEYEDGKTHTYKDTYYISGILKESGTRFYVLIPTINISMKKLDLEMKISGKINLFYNGTADVEKSGTVTVAPKDKKTTLKIEKCELIGKTKSNGVNTADDEAFAGNFTAELDYDTQKITITRNPESETLLRYSAGTDKVKGKAVTSGILKVYYEGYGEDYAKEISITVPTHTTVPSYNVKLTKVTEDGTKQSLKKITLNENASGQQYEVSFVNKKTKKVEDITADTTIQVDYQDGATPYGLIVDEGDDGILEADLEEDVVPIQIADAQKGKLVIVLRQPDWEYSETSFVKVSVAVSVTKNKPSVKLGKNTLTLNSACTAAAASTSMKLNQSDSTLAEEQEFVSLTNGGENIWVYYDSDSQTVKAQIIGEVDRGTYQFSCTPVFSYNGDDRLIEAKTIKLKVKVNNQTPSIKLKSSVFTVNADCYDDGEGKYDSMIRSFNWVNLPEEYSDYELSTDMMTLDYKGRGSDPFGMSDDGTYVQFAINAADKEAEVWITADRKISGSATYMVNGLELVNGSEIVAVKPFKITVKSVDKTPTVKIKAKGSINPLDPESQILYTPTLTNISGTVENVMIKELSRSGAPVAEGEEHFYAYQDSETGNTVLKVKEGTQLENRTYKIKLYYELSNGDRGTRGDGWYFAKDIKVTPKQVMPKLTIDKKSATFFAGDKSRTQTITVTKKDTTTAEIVDIKFSDKVAKNIQEAFAINYNPENGEMELCLVNSAFIKQDVSQTLTFEIVCDGQLVDTTGRTFTVKVKVIK